MVISSLWQGRRSCVVTRTTNVVRIADKKLTHQCCITWYMNTFDQPKHCDTMDLYMISKSN